MKRYLRFLSFGFVLIAVFNLTHSQQPPQPAAQPQAEEKFEFVPLNSKIESYYKLLYKNQQEGYGSIIINPYTEEKEKPIEFSSQLQQTEEGQSLVSEQLKASLDSAFNVKEFDYKYAFLQKGMSAILDPVAKQLILRNPEGTEKSLSLEGKQNVFFHLHLALFVLAQKGLLLKIPTHTVQVLIPRHDEVVLEELTISATTVQKRKYANELLTVMAIKIIKAPERYNVTELYIDNYGRVLEFNTLVEIKFILTKESQFSKITDKIESWYRIIREKKQIGYGFSIIQPKEDGIDFDAETHVRVGYTGLTVYRSQKISASFDSEYNLKKFTYKYIFPYVEYEISYSQDQHLFVTTLPDGKKITTNYQIGKDVFVFVQPALLALCQTESIYKAVTYKIVYLKPHVLISYLITRLPPKMQDVLPETELRFIKAERRQVLEQEAYVLRLSCPIEDLFIVDFYTGLYSFEEEKETEGLASITFIADKYGRILDINVADSVRFIIAKDEQDAKGLIEFIPPTHLRDPFDKMAVFAGRFPADEVPTEIPLVKFNREYKELQDLLLKIKTYKEKKDEKNLMKAYAEFIRKHQLLVADPEIDESQRQRLIELKDRITKIIPEHEAIMYEFDATYEAFVEAVGKEDLESSRNLLGRLQQISANPLFTGKDREKIDGMVAQATLIVIRLDSARQLEQVALNIRGIAYEVYTVQKKVSVNLDIFGSGLIAEEKFQVPRTRAYAIINGTIYSQGDVLKARSKEQELELLIEKVHKNRVTISYNNVQRDFFIEK